MLIRTLLSILLVAQLAACGKTGNTTDTTAAPGSAAAPAAAPAAADPLAKGEHVFKGTCVMCHGTGAGGAPLFGSLAEWGPRIAQGKETLYGHALKGFTGAKGTMPPKGANAGLSDDDVKAAVDYMVSQAK